MIKYLTIQTTVNLLSVKVSCKEIRKCSMLDVECTMLINESIKFTISLNDNS